MCNVGLVMRRNEKGPGFIQMLSLGDINPSLLVLTAIGERLAELLDAVAEISAEISATDFDFDETFLYVFQPYNSEIEATSLSPDSSDKDLPVTGV